MVREAGLFIAPTLGLERCGRAVYIGLSIRRFIAGAGDGATRQPRLCDVNAQVGEGPGRRGGLSADACCPQRKAADENVTTGAGCGLDRL